MKYYRTKVSGVTAPDNQVYVRVSDSGKVAFLLLSDLSTGGSSAFDQIARQGIAIGGTPHFNWIRDEARQLTHFPRRDLVLEVGWNGLAFARPDGTIFGGKGPAGAAAAVFVAEPGRLDVTGSIAGWKKAAKRLAGHPLPIAVICMALVAPILAFYPQRTSNCGFQLVADLSDRNRLRIILMSVIGTSRRDVAHLDDLSSIVSDPDRYLELSRDHPLVISGINSYFAKSRLKGKAGEVPSLVIDLLDGRRSGKLKVVQPSPIRLAFFLISKQRISDTIELSEPAAARLADGLATIDLFDRGLFQGGLSVSDTSDLWTDIYARLSANRGRVLKSFQRRLVDERVKNGPAVANQIEKSVATFMRNVGLNKAASEASAIASAEPFALAYAAGRLAQSYGLLPKKWKCGSAVKACYEVHLRANPPARTFVERLIELADGDGAITLQPKRKKLADDQITNATVFILPNKRQRQVAMLPETFERLFEDHAALLRKPEVIALMKRGNDRREVSVRLAKGVDRRVYVFTLPREK